MTDIEKMDYIYIITKKTPSPPSTFLYSYLGIARSGAAANDFCKDYLSGGGSGQLTIIQQGDEWWDNTYKDYEPDPQ